MQVDASGVRHRQCRRDAARQMARAESPAGAKLGYDPWLHTVDGAEKLARACTDAGAALTPAEPNPVDAIWTDRPAPPMGAVTLHDFRYAGEYASSKLNRIRAEVANLRADALVISDPHAVAWAFNIRGSDVAHTPLPLCFAIVPQEGKPALYVDSAKLSNAVRHNLEEIANIREPADFIRELTALGLTGKTVRLDQATAADALARIVTTSGGKVTRGADPIAHDEGGEEPGRDRGRARGASARRRGDDALSRLVRPRGAERRTHRDRRGRSAGKLPPRHRPAEGRVVPVDLRRRTGRRHRALPRDARDRPSHQARRAVPDRFRRPVRGRHHRHHPHRRGRRADARKCASASRWC